MTEYKIIEKDGYKYIDIGPRNELSPLVLLHGLFGTASNFDGVIESFSKVRRVIMPILPIFEMSIRKLSLTGLLEHFVDFLQVVPLPRFNLLGNSLGGHLAIIYALDHQEALSSLVLTGSSGLYESAFGSSFPKRGDYEFISGKVKLTFYDPNIATKEMIDEVFDIVNDRMKGIRIIKTAKSAIRHNVEDRLPELLVPTLLVWGKDDTITPAFVGEKFNSLIRNSKLHVIDKCGHAPMLERAEVFNAILDRFLTNLEVGSL